jgi:hypothetical protein
LCLRYAPFEGNFEVGDIMKDEIDKGFITLLSEKVDERV